jgi:putative Mg2+ transporter-C (MgtC) family protein
MASPWYIDPIFIAVRLLLALLLGGLIGLERERSNHAAGFRTHILVCIGSTLVMLLSMYGFSEFVGENNVNMDPARLAAQVISGIGFLGAGVILRNGLSITGLTTAASLWVVAAIGLAIGAGFYLAAVICTVLVIFSLLILNIVEQKWLYVKRIHLIRIRAEDRAASLGPISSVLESKKIEIRKIAVEQNRGTDPNGENPSIYITMTVNIRKRITLLSVIQEISALQGVIEVAAE